MDRSGVRAPGVRDNRESCRILAWPNVPEQAADRIRKLFPDGAPCDQRAIARSGQGIDPPPPPGVGGDPAAAEQAGQFKTMQRRVDRALGKIERTAAPPLDLLDNRIAMGRTRRRQRSEHDHVEVALEHFTFHTLYD